MFLLDTNVFINASRSYYHPDIAPAFWDWLEGQYAQGNVASITNVRSELNPSGSKQVDFLKNWVGNLPDEFWFEPLSQATASMGNVANWAMSPGSQYTQSAISEFLSVADSYLVAQAHELQCQVASFEASRPGAQKRIALPEACQAMGVNYVDPFDMYLQLGLKF